MFSSGARFTLGAILFLENRHQAQATFDLFIRDLPAPRNYLVSAGLEHIISFLLNYRLKPEHITYFKKYFDFNRRTLDFYRRLRFTGDVWAMPEGTLAFGSEPIVRITAPIVQGMIIEQYLTNSLMLQTMLASKISRVINAAGGKKVGLTFARTHGLDSAMKAVRAGKIVGLQLTGLPLATMKYDIPGSYGAMTCHYFISFFDSEKEAFRTYIKHFKDQGDILIDTYDNDRGLKNLIEVLKEGNGGVKSAVLDSGNLAELAKKVRVELDRNGLQKVKIFGMGNLDEYSIQRIERETSAFDFYGLATEVVNVTDAPKLESVYKLSEIREGRAIKPKMKLAHHKISLPGRKQVFRQEQNGRYSDDVIGLENEGVKGKKLLIQYVKNGRLIRPLPSIPEINRHYESERRKFNPSLFSINRKINFPVSISPGLRQLMRQTRSEIKKQNA